MFSIIREKTFWMMAKGKILDGVFAVNKPSGISSAQVLRDLQVHFNSSELFAPWLEAERRIRGKESRNQRFRRRDKKIQVKIGHGGTLDPMATGVLITGVGRGTKSLINFLTCTKTYETVVLFGTSTDTYDSFGKVLKRAPFEHITKEMVEKALEKFRGTFMQMPPLFSALKMDGKPLYEYAREGKEIPRNIERRQTEVMELEFVEWMEGGTHTYKAPTDEAGYAEINVANQVWAQVKNIDNSSTESAKEVEPSHTMASESQVESQIKDDSLPTTQCKQTEKEPEQEHSENSSSLTKETTLNTQTSELESFEIQKRKLTNSEEDPVSNEPLKKQKTEPSDSSANDATVSDGLLDSSSENQITPQVKIEEASPPAVRLRMTVKSGFYVRSLCHDLGLAVGSSAIMAELNRTRQGDFVLGKNTLEYSDLEQGEKVWGPKVEQWLEDWKMKHPSVLGTSEGLAKGDGVGENSDHKRNVNTRSSHYAGYKPNGKVDRSRESSAEGNDRKQKNLIRYVTPRLNDDSGKTVDNKIGDQEASVKPEPSA